MCPEETTAFLNHAGNHEFPVVVLDFWVYGRARQLGYAIHAHCWVLIERIIGRTLVESSLLMFKQSLRDFWSEQEEGLAELCRPQPFDDDFKSYNPTDAAAIYAKHVDFTRSPAGVPEIRRLIEAATQPGRVAIHRSGPLLVPLEIAIMIVDAIYYGPSYDVASLEDTRNLLVAFRWQLPDTYWRGRCFQDLIFEVKDLIKENIAVDWQFLCPGLEGLLVDHEWYEGSGLRNRARLMPMLKRIKAIFVHLLEESWF